MQIGKPSYAQVCELEAVLVNGVDFTTLVALQPARELGRFADPEGLRKVSKSCGVRCLPAVLAVDVFGACLYLRACLNKKWLLPVHRVGICTFRRQVTEPGRC